MPLQWPVGFGTIPEKAYGHAAAKAEGRTQLRFWSRLGLSGQILFGLAVGILIGVFVGEPAAALAPLADVYIKLMQMTVLPYLISVLVVAFGQLDMAAARRLATRGGLLLLLIWAITIFVLVAIPLALPALTSAAFYSDSLVSPVEPFSLAELYFTANPFESLSQGIVPAVVMFSCVIGIALIRLRNKEALLGPLRVWNEAIVVVTRFVISLTPFGVLAIAAVAAGTMPLETLERLQAYFIAFAAASALLGFVILPLLVTAVTPFRYREVVSIAHDALITAFVANNAFIVLPILVERSKELIERHGLRNEQTDSASEVMIPVLFNFPNAGKLLTLLFVPFVAWLSGTPLAGADYPALFAVGIPSYFAKAQVALPFLLDVFGLPQDLFQLYIPTTILTGKFDSMVTAMNLLVFALIGAGAVGGFLLFERRRILRSALVIAAATVVTVATLRLVLGATIDTTYTLDEAMRRMHTLRDAESAIIHRDLAELEPAADAATAFARIRARGSIRVGYDPGNLPFSFFNGEDQLVGFDIELAMALAEELGVRAEFVPITWPELPRLLDEGIVDVMPGVWYRPNWFGELLLTSPYMVGTMALAVRDERRREFADIARLRNSEGLTIALPLDRRQVEFSRQHYFDAADVEYVIVEFWDSYFEGEHPDVDAFLMPAEHASGWTLLHPEYTVVVPQPDPVRISTAFGVSQSSIELAEAVNEWIVYASDTGAIDDAYDYWVRGRGVESDEPRWSIMRNVLGWGRR